MNAFDEAILRFFESFSGSLPRLDFWISVIAESDLFKGYVVMAVVWWLWFPRTSSSGPDWNVERSREHIVATLVACLVALVVARGLAQILPFRPRPFSTAEFAGGFALGRAQRGLDTWTAFPSDHATLFAALVTGLWFASRRASMLLLGYIVLVVLVPRVYLGMHYPTDILAGCGIGFAIAWAANSQTLRPVLVHPLTRWRAASPGTFYACAFLLTSQIAMLFDPVRHLMSFAADFASGSPGVAINAAP